MKRKREEILLNDKYERINHTLSERVKELNCLYGLSKLVEKPNISLPKIFNGLVKLLPLAWQYPDITCARLTIENRIYKTQNFDETEWMQSSDIIFHGRSIGKLEVFYLQEKPKEVYGPFLIEEKNLLNVICERLGKIIERKRAEENLKKSGIVIREQKKALERKNIALQEILAQIEIEKKKIKDDIVANVEQILLPNVEKLKIRGAAIEYIDLLEQNLKEIASTFGTKISTINTQLTQREIEICIMVKNGLSTKEIASLLNIACHTVEKHRARIRNKFNLKNTKVNLNTYLHTI